MYHIADELPPPPGWGTDLLTNFFSEARNGMFASYVNFPTTYRLLLMTAQTFEQTRQAIQNSSDEKEEAIALMALRSYGYFMSASQAALSGLVPEAYQMARACLEATVYAFRIAEQPENVQTWFNRHSDDDARKASRKLFG